MNIIILSTIIACSFFIGCDRSPHRKPMSEPPASPPSHTSETRTDPKVAESSDSHISTTGVASQQTAPSRTIQERYASLATRQTDNGLIEENALQELVKMLPALLESGYFNDMLRLVPVSQRAPFRGATLAYLKNLTPAADGPLAEHYREVLHTASWNQDPEIARFLLDRLDQVSAYAIPPKPKDFDERKVDRETSDYVERGTQGRMARTIVELGDEATLARYREKLLAAPPNARRAMIYALGESHDLVDFNLLTALLPKEANAEIHDELVEALNAISISMWRVSRYPQSVPDDRRPKDPEKLRQTAQQCRDRLQAMGLVRGNWPERR